MIKYNINEDHTKKIIDFLIITLYKQIRTYNTI